MAAASDYLENKLVENVLRGVNFEPPTTIFVALHTADPGETGLNEMSLTTFPAYARQDAAKGETVDTGWIPAVGGVTKNAKQLIFPVYDGVAPITITHYALWDAATAGNVLVHGQLTTPRTLNPGDVFVIDVQKLTVSVL